MAVTLCPIALAVGCRRCPAYRVCPLKRVVGDQRANAEAAPAADAPTVRRKGGAKSGRRAARRK